MTGELKKANGKYLIVGIPLAALMGAALAYGTLCSIVDTNKADLADIKPRLVRVEIAIGEGRVQYQEIMRQLSRIENKVDKQ